MKKNIHPSDYRTVVFQDLNNNWSFLTKSTVTTEETIKWEDGKEYPLLKVHISSSSHPFYTGQEKMLDIEGRVDKFKARALAAEKAKEARTSAAKKKTTQKAEKDEKKAAKKEASQPTTTAQ
jgi:large subunit ribosomal protein L31